MYMFSLFCNDALKRAMLSILEVLVLLEVDDFVIPLRGKRKAESFTVVNVIQN